MSMTLAKIVASAAKKNRTRAQTLSLTPALVYDDGRTLQCHADECDINKIMARFTKTGTITHLAKHEGTYSDFSDFDFAAHTQKLTKGREVFDSLPGELRREFDQSPQAFFDHVNDPANAAKPHYGLPALAQPGDQLPRPANNNDADALAASAAAGSSAATPPADSAETQPDATPSV